MSQVTYNQVKDHLNIVFDRVIGILEQGDFKVEFSKRAYFAGGCIVSLFQGDTIRDYDIFLDEGTMAQLTKEYFNNHREFVKVVSENAITLQIPGIEPVVQIITRFSGPPQRVFTTFDFEHCKAFFRPFPFQELYANYGLIAAKLLRYSGEKDMYPLNTLKRAMKYIARGYEIDNASVVNLCKACHKVDLTDPEQMRIQAVGFYGSSFK